jgi:hypothetical protein
MVLLLLLLFNCLFHDTSNNEGLSRSLCLPSVIVSHTNRRRVLVDKSIAPRLILIGTKILSGREYTD